MNYSITRTDSWHLSPTPEQQRYLMLTVLEYRAFCRALVGVVNTHIKSEKLTLILELGSETLPLHLPIV
ncbi:MAG: hypothetical protein ACLFTJ_11220 [Halothece sp.]